MKLRTNIRTPKTNHSLTLANLSTAPTRNPVRRISFVFNNYDVVADV
jgi:hypothetical protein